MEQFSLEKYIENPSRKVVTRDGRPVRIICTDANEETPIAALVTVKDIGLYRLATALYTKDGRYGVGNSPYDLFFADEEEELTELQKTLEEDCDCYVNLYNNGKTREELREWIKCWCHRIIELATKELEKSSPCSGTSFEHNGHIWDMCTRDNGVDVSCDKHLIRHLEKQDEQKPKEETKFYDSMDDLTADTLIKEIEGSELDDREKHNFIYWIKSHMQNHAWDEEDEKIINDAIWLIEHYATDGHKKLLREQTIDKLKSIKHQKHWKPSEEQMNALDKAKNSPANYYDTRLGLQLLYNDLLKL